MENKIQQLTSKLYEEGLQKGKSESEKLISEAKSQAEKIINDAKKSADDIIAAASLRDSEMHDAAIRDVSLASRRIIADLKESVKDMLAYTAVSSEVKDNFNNVEFVGSLINSIVENWSKQSPNSMINIVIPENKSDQFTSFIKKRTSENLLKNLEIKSDTRLNSGFRISSSDSRFYISFTDEQFENFFKEYIRAKVADMIFGK